MVNELFNIYVASYKRAATTTTFKAIPCCTYVVRKSEEKDYLAAGVESVLAVEDNLICSFPKVQNYIIHNTPEDIICVMDDDITKWYYRNGLRKREIYDMSVVLSELVRIAQCMLDLDIGLGGLSQTTVPYTSKQEINFNKMTGPVRFFNKSVLKSRYEEIKFFNDIDFVLQELLVNRIVFRPNYICAMSGIETNSGGANTDRVTAERKKIYTEVMIPKWGKYFRYNEKKNTPYLSVPR